MKREPRKNPFKENIGTLTALFWDEDVEGLLRLCEISNIGFDENASQYERFCALCDAIALSPAHPTGLRCQALLKETLGIDLPILPENAELLWRVTAERFLLDPVKRKDLLQSARDRSDTEAFNEELSLLTPKTFSPVDFLFLWENTEKLTSWQAWEQRAEGLLTELLDETADAVLLELPRSFHFAEPNLYTIGQLLKSDPPLAQSDLWRGQVARFLSEQCIKRNKTLCLRILCDGEEAEKLLSYLQRSVSIGKLSWTSPSEKTQKKLVELQSKPHKGEWYWSLLRTDIPNEETWAATLSRYATLYPIKRLSVWKES